MVRSYKYTISKEAINKLPLKTYCGPVYMISSEDQMPSSLNHLNKERILGFDVETKPSFRKGESYPPSLLQLASSEAVYVFQINCLSFPNGLNELMSNPNILKVGVGLDVDIQKINEVSPFETEGCIELGSMVNKLGVKNTGLRSLAANFLGFRISKKAKCSDWSKKILSPDQIAYAATDAWVGREIYLYLERLELIQ